MKATTWQILHTLTEHYHSGPTKELLQYLSKEDQNAFNEASPATTFSLFSAFPEKIFSSFHYSWLAAHLQRTPEPFRSLVVNALDQEQAKHLTYLIKDPVSTKPFSAPVKAFILEQFHKNYAKNLHLFPDQEEKKELSFLLDCPTERINELIHLLGLWDLSEGLRRIIDKERLKAVFICFSPREQIFLKNCLRERDRLALHSIGLERWNGKKEELRSILYDRGLSRMGKALSGHPLDLIKKICIKLEITKAKKLIEYIHKNVAPKITPIAIIQIKQIVKFLEKQESN